MRLGFTSNIFAQPLKSGQVTLKELLSLGKGHRLRAMEIRDDEVRLSLQEVEDLKKTADGLGMQLTYAIKNDMLTPGDEEKFRAALESNALSNQNPAGCKRLKSRRQDLFICYDCNGITTTRND